MALIVEDGTGLAAADSFGSVADADTYLTNRYGATNLFVAQASADQKDAWMRQAADFIETSFGPRLSGERKTTTQALCWPRTNAVRTDGFGQSQIVSSTIVPQAFQSAQFEAARLLADGTSLVATTGNQRRLTKLDVLTFEYDEGARSQSFPQIERIVDPYLAFTSGVARVERG